MSSPTEPPEPPSIAGGTLGEPMARDNWLALYDKATKRLDEAGGGAIFNAMFAGNEWDLLITFRRFDKGELARNIDQARAAAAAGETLSPDELDQRLGA